MFSFLKKEGHPYDKSRMTGLLTYQDKTDPENSFVLNTRMPSGKTANMLAAIKFVNAVRMGEVKFTAEDIRRAEGLGVMIRDMISSDNERYCRVFHKMRAVLDDARLTPPNISGYNLPDFKLCEGENDVTLTQSDFGRGFEVYRVGGLFRPEDIANPTDDQWKTVVQIVLSAWGIAEASVILPNELNAWTKCSKKSLGALRKWTFVRNTGYYPPNADDTPGSRASAEDIAWAALPFEDF